MTERNEKQPKRVALHNPAQFAYRTVRNDIHVVSCAAKKYDKNPCSAQLIINVDTVETIVAQALNDGWTFYLWQKKDVLIPYCPKHAGRKSNPPAIIAFMSWRTSLVAPTVRKSTKPTKLTRPSKGIQRLRGLL